MKPDNLFEPSATALVVNDDVTQIKLLTSLLNKEGMKVLPFLDAESALLAMVNNGPPALIITDLYMPGLDGWRFCRLLRSLEYQAFNQTPILIISATFSGDETARITADLGADAFLSSPVDPGEFSGQVRNLLAGRRLQQQLRVLIIEDSAALADLLKKTFDAHGYGVGTARTVKEAVAAFDKSRWDVAVIDYHLPDGEGDKLLIDFRARQRDCVCIMMTGDADPELALDLMKKGAAAYLHKPFSPAYLIEMCAKTRRERALLRVQDLLEIRTRELQKSDEQYRLLVENASDMVFRTDVNGYFTFVNPALLRITGYEEKDIIGRQYTTLISPGRRDEALRFFGDQLANGISNTYSEYPVLTKDGREFWVGQNAQLVVEGGNVTGFQIVARDITERKQMEEKLRESEQRYRELSIIDDLTQLYNSRHFYNQLKIEIDRVTRYENQPITLLLLDLDNFKEFNDTYGHVEGDHVLSRLGQMIKKCLRETDLAYRYGGEEFTVLLPMTTSRDGIVTAERIRTEFKKESFSPAPDKNVFMTTSIGVAQYRNGEDIKDFVQRADQLMYQAKNNGKDRICCET